MKIAPSSHLSIRDLRNGWAVRCSSNVAKGQITRVLVNCLKGQSLSKSTCLYMFKPLLFMFIGAIDQVIGMSFYPIVI